MSQTKNSSYKKMFSDMNTCEDVFELRVIERIKEDYMKHHSHDFQLLEKMIADESKELSCPKCHSLNFNKHGLDKNGTQRYKCKECGKTFNNAKNSLFFSGKVNLSAWLVFLECILSGTSTKVACINAKISTVTGSEWMKKIFKAISNYQDNIILQGDVFIDETYIHEDSSKLFFYDEIGKIKKVKKQPRGISRNKICILVATDKMHSFAKIICHGRPQRILNYAVCKQHLGNDVHLIGDQDTSLTYTVKRMKLKRTTYKVNTEEAYEKLEPIDQLCSRFKYFISKHRGFKKELLQDYINLFIFIENENRKNINLYVTTVKLLKILINTEYQKRG